MKKNYIYIKTDEALKGVVEVHLDDAITTYKIDNFNIVDNVNISSKALEAIDTAKFLHQYRLDKGLETWYNQVVTISN